VAGSLLTVASGKTATRVRGVKGATCSNSSVLFVPAFVEKSACAVAA